MPYVKAEMDTNWIRIMVIDVYNVREQSTCVPTNDIDSAAILRIVVYISYDLYMFTAKCVN